MAEEEKEKGLWDKTKAFVKKYTPSAKTMRNTAAAVALGATFMAPGQTEAAQHQQEALNQYNSQPKMQQSWELSAEQKAEQQEKAQAINKGGLTQKQIQERQQLVDAISKYQKENPGKNLSPELTKKLGEIRRADLMRAYAERRARTQQADQQTR